MRERTETTSTDVAMDANVVFANIITLENININPYDPALQGEQYCENINLLCRFLTTTEKLTKLNVKLKDILQYVKRAELKATNRAEANTRAQKAPINIAPYLAEIGFTLKKLCSIDQSNPINAHNTMLQHITELGTLIDFGFTTSNLSSMLTRSAASLSTSLIALSSDDAMNKFQTAIDLGFTHSQISSALHGRSGAYLTKLDLLANAELTVEITSRTKGSRINITLNNMLKEQDALNTTAPNAQIDTPEQAVQKRPLEQNTDTKNIKTLRIESPTHAEKENSHSQDSPRPSSHNPTTLRREPLSPVSHFLGRTQSQDSNNSQYRYIKATTQLLLDVKDSPSAPPR